MGNNRSFAQQLCVKKAGLLLHATGALEAGCRIGIAVSGGVDSFTLVKVMRIRQKLLPFPIELMALHLNPGFEPASHARLASWLAAEGVASHIELTDFGPRAHSPENRAASACFYCAWLRRKRLFELCRKYRLSHLAMGHNAEDMAATFMLNAFRNGNIQGMAGVEDFFGGRLRMLRPLLLVEKKYIIQAARQWRLPYWVNQCPSAGKTARGEMEALLARMDKSLPGAKRSLINGLGRQELARGRARSACAGKSLQAR